jgi:hypothetical protein
LSDQTQRTRTASPVNDTLTDSKRSKRRAEEDNRDESEHRAHNTDYNNVEIALPMCRSAYGEQGHNSAVMRKNIKGSCAERVSKRKGTTRLGSGPFPHPVRRRTINAIDLRTLDRHRDAAVSSLIPALSCRSCRPNAPFAELVRLSRTSIADEVRIEHTRRVLRD